MKKRILAIVMALTMAVAFMPVMSFAYENDAASADQAAGEVDQQVLDAQAQAIEAIQNLLKDLDIEAVYNQAHGYIDQAQGYVDQVHGYVDIACFIVWMVQNGYIDELEEQTAILDGYIRAANNYVADFAYSPETQAALQGYLAAAEDLKAKIEEYTGLEIPDFPENEQEAQAIIDAAKAAIEEAQAKYDEAVAKLQEALAGDVAAMLQEYIEEAAAWAVEQGVDQGMIDELLEQAAKLQDLVDLYEELGSPSSLDALVDLAKQALEDNADKIQDAIDAAVDKAVAALQEAYNNGEFDEYIDQLAQQVGMTGDEMKALVGDIVAYAEGLQNGESYKALKDENAALEESLKDAGADLIDLTATLDGLQKTIDDLNKEIVAKDKTLKSDKTYINNLKNALKVQLAKPVLAKKQVSKKKRITIKWKNIKKSKCKITGYQVWYKVKGKKKWTKKTVANKKAAAKFVKMKTKKLKKGKKVKIKVRGIFKFKQPNGKFKKVYTKWSKTKTVKVKK